MRELQTVNSYTQRVKEELIAQGIIPKQRQSPSNGQPRPFPPNIHGPFPYANAHYSLAYHVVGSAPCPYYSFPNATPQFVVNPSHYPPHSVLSDVVNRHDSILNTEIAPCYTY